MRTAQPSISAALGALLVVPLAAAFAGSDPGGVVWACLPAAAIAGWLLAGLALRAERPIQVIGAALAFGASTAFGGVLLFMLATMAAALLPGSSVARPESPLGYVLMLVITLVSLTPFLAVPASVVGLVWASLVGRPRQGRGAQPTSARRGDKASSVTHRSGSGRLVHQANLPQ